MGSSCGASTPISLSINLRVKEADPRIKGEGSPSAFKGSSRPSRRCLSKTEALVDVILFAKEDLFETAPSPRTRLFESRTGIEKDVLGRAADERKGGFVACGGGGAGTSRREDLLFGGVNKDSKIPCPTTHTR